MPLEQWSENVVVVRLADSPQTGEDLEALDQAVQNGVAGKRRLDAVVDFSGVKIINSSNLAKLIKIRRQMHAADARLLFCGTNDHVWGAFLVTNLDKLFEFADDVPTALATLQMNAK